MEVSIYKNVSDTKGVSGDLIAFLTTDKWKDLSLEIRAEKDKSKRDRLKKKLPCCTPSGLFKARNKKGLITHSGIVCVDIDIKDNPAITDWQKQVQQLGHIREVMFAGLSVSGNGAFCLIKIADPTQHESYFREIEEGFFQYGTTLDKACRDVSRLRFYSYNEKFYYNPDAEVFARLARAPRRTNAHLGATANPREVDQLVEEIVLNGVDIVPTYRDWIDCAMALTNVPNGRGLFHAISAVNSDMYDPLECDKKFSSFTPGGATGIGTLFHLAKKYNARAINDFKEDLI